MTGPAAVFLLKGAESRDCALDSLPALSRTQEERQRECGCKGGGRRIRCTPPAIGSLPPQRPLGRTADGIMVGHQHSELDRLKCGVVRRRPPVRPPAAVSALMRRDRPPGGSGFRGGLV